MPSCCAVQLFRMMSITCRDKPATIAQDKLDEVTLAGYYS